MPRHTWLQKLIEKLASATTRMRSRSRSVRLRTVPATEPLEVRQMLSGGPVNHAHAMTSMNVLAGPEIQFNMHTTGDQVRPKVAMDAKGDYVVVWTDYSGLDGSGQGIFAQRYTAASVPQGGNFRVNAYTTGNQFRPTVAMDSAGDFVVTWSSYGRDGHGWGIFAQRYNAAGVAEGHEFQVNVYTTRDQVFSAVAMDSTGDFVITWTSVTSSVSSSGIFARMYNANGTARTAEFKVNSYTTGAQDHSAVAMDSKGDFVVTWDASAGDGSGYGIFARRFNAAGVPLGLDFTVNTYASNNQLAPAIAMDPAGDFVIAWDSELKDGSSFGVAARRFNAAAVAQGPEFNVNTFTKGLQFSPAVAMDNAGDFAIAWDSDKQDGSLDGVYVRRYNSAGTALAIELRVNSYTTSVQAAPSIAMDALGDFVVAWDSFGQDGSGYGAFLKRYKAA